MSRNKKWVPFPYLTSDYKAAEEWLNQRAEEGWQVAAANSYFRLVKLVRREGPVVRYCVDLFEPNQPEESDYLDLCREAGWTPVAEVQSMRLFASQPGASPAPIQTDSEIELRRFEGKYFWRQCRGILLSLGFFLVLLSVMIVNGVLQPFNLARMALELLYNWWELFLPAIGLIFFPIWVWQVAAQITYWRRGRRAIKAGAPLPVPDPRQARRRAWPQFLAIPLVFLMLAFQLLRFFLPSTDSRRLTADERTGLRDKPIVFAQDVGLEYDEDYSQWEAASSPLARHSRFVDTVAFTTPGRGTACFGLTTEYFRLPSEGMAAWAAEVLLDYSYVLNFDPTFTPVDLGFDESWLYTFEPNDLSPEPQAILVLRQGSTAAKLEGPVDWTAPDIRAMLWERLQLEE